MEVISAFVLIIVSVSFSVALNVAVLMNGWGMEPKSWAWIIGVGVFGTVLAHTFASKAFDHFSKVVNK